MKETINLDAQKAAAAKLFDLNLKNKDRHYIVAIDKDLVVGFVLCEVNGVYTDHGSVNDLYVISEQRRGGIDSRLTKQAENWLKDQGLKKNSIAVHNSNSAAIKSYKSLGYEDDPDDYIYLAKEVNKDEPRL